MAAKQIAFDTEQIQAIIDVQAAAEKAVEDVFETLVKCAANFRGDQIFGESTWKESMLPSFDLLVGKTQDLPDNGDDMQNVSQYGIRGAVLGSTKIISGNIKTVAEKMGIRQSAMKRDIDQAGQDLAAAARKASAAAAGRN